MNDTKADTRPSVIVVGAGVGGVAAAARLQAVQFDTPTRLRA
jgi:cation diffusion facilitator CzcD-associated flavoprotein CzcO